MEKGTHKPEKKNMKHAVIVAGESTGGRFVEAELADGRRICLSEKEYTREELEDFRAAASKWIVRLSGSRQFLADSDSGEDATGYYRAFFEPTPERAVFENGRPVGFYLCTDGMRFPGRHGHHGPHSHHADCGPRGPFGPHGECGHPGDFGPRGPHGDCCHHGDFGPRGPHGECGHHGDFGPRGPHGECGRSDDFGPRCPHGECCHHCPFGPHWDRPDDERPE